MELSEYLPGLGAILTFLGAVIAVSVVWGAVSLHRIAFHMRNISDDSDLLSNEMDYLC